MSDYATLQSRLVDLLQDTQVDTVKAKEFIGLCEYKLDRDLIDSANGGQIPRQKMARVTGQADSGGTFVLPSDYHDARSVKVKGNQARYASPELVTGDDSGFADADITLDYYQRIPVLSDTNTSNWVLDIGFDAYLYGAALQWIAWGQDQENMVLWTTFYRDAMRTVKSTHSARPSGGNRRQNGRYYTSFYTIIGDTMYFGNPR